MYCIRGAGTILEVKVFVLIGGSGDACTVLEMHALYLKYRHCIRVRGTILVLYLRSPKVLHQ